jgi:hypothetical protein
MIHVTTSIKIPHIFQNKISIINAFMETGNECVDVGLKEAQITYKKKVKNPSGFTYGAFTIDMAKLTGDIEVTSYFMNLSPYAKFINWDRKLRNGKWWSEVNPDAPYLFMEAGLLKISQVAPQKLTKNLNKLSK